MHRLSASLVIFFIVLASVCRTFLANRKGSNRWLPLPPVTSSVKADLSMEELVDLVDRVVKLSVWNTAHPCLYYAYARCRILRRWGHPVKLNIGLHNLYGEQEVEGHCWLSLENKVLFEEKDPCQMYPDRMGERGDTVYWARLKGGEEEFILRLKKGEE